MSFITFVFHVFGTIYNSSWGKYNENCREWPHPVLLKDNDSMRPNDMPSFQDLVWDPRTRAGDRFAHLSNPISFLTLMRPVLYPLVKTAVADII